MQDKLTECRKSITWRCEGPDCRAKLGMIYPLTQTASIKMGEAFYLIVGTDYEISTACRKCGFFNQRVLTEKVRS